MSHIKLQIIFFYIFLGIVLIVSAFILFPFLKVLFLAGVLAVIFYPVYRKISKHLSFKGGQSLSAFLTVIIIFLAILIPFTGLSFLIFQEVNDMYTSLISDSSGSFYSFVQSSSEYLNRIIPFGSIPSVTPDDIQVYAKEAYTWAFSHARGFFSGALNIMLTMFILTFSVFFFLRDGDKFRKALISLSPLKDSYDREIISKVELAISSVIKGKLLIAILQGCLAAIGFALFGVPSPVLWGAVTVIAAIVPGIGTPLVILPAILYLFFVKHEIGPAIGLAAWGLVIVGLIDNVLGPYLIERGIKVHPFLILLSVLGGLAVFGPIGFLAGPIILSLLFALIHLYPTITKRDI